MTNRTFMDLSKQELAELEFELKWLSETKDIPEWAKGIGAYGFVTEMLSRKEKASK